MNVRMKCGGCGIIASFAVPLCPECQARELAGKPGGIVGWVPYLMVPVQSAGPFFTREARDAWYKNMNITHPHLVGTRVDCFEEVIPEARVREIDKGH